MKTRILAPLFLLGALTAFGTPAEDDIPMSDITRRQIEMSEAAPGAARQTSYYEFARKVALGSPEAKAAKAQVEAIEQTGKAENTLSGIELEGEYKFGPEGDRRWGVSVGQEFEWPGVYSARRKANAFRSEAYRHLYHVAVRERWCRAAEAMVNYWQTTRAESILETAKENLLQLDSIYTRLLARGETTVLETKKIALQLSMLENRLAEATAQRGAAFYGMQYDCYVADESTIPPLTMPTEPVAHINVYQNALIADGGVNSMRSFHSAAEAELSVARRKALPSFKLAYVHDYEDGKHFNGIGLSVTLPSWAPSHATAAARAQVLQAEQELNSYVISADQQFAANYTMAGLLYERVEASKALYDMDDYPAILRKALDAGRLTLLDYLTEYNFYLEAMEDFVNLCGDYLRARIQIEQYLVSDGLAD